MLTHSEEICYMYLNSSLCSHSFFQTSVCLIEFAAVFQGIGFLGSFLTPDSLLLDLRTVWVFEDTGCGDERVPLTSMGASVNASFAMRFPCLSWGFLVTQLSLCFSSLSAQSLLYPGGNHC